MIRADDKVIVKETKDVGYVAKVLDGGDRLIVRVPPSDKWPFPHHICVHTEKVSRMKGDKSSFEEAPF